MVEESGRRRSDADPTAEPPRAPEPGLGPPPALSPAGRAIPARPPGATIVGAEARVRPALGDALETAGFVVDTATSAEACLDALRADPSATDVVLSEIELPGTDGFALLERLGELDDALSVVLTTDVEDYATVRRAMSAGAYDCLAGPARRVEETVDAVRRAADATRLVREREALLEEARERNALLHALNGELEILASTDALTGVFNRRHVDRTLERQMALRGQTPFAVSILLLDIDHFKRINDDHGHETGDEVLRRVALTLLSTLRPGDLVGRYGGEEFLIALIGVAPSEAESVAARVLGALGSIGVERGDAVVGVGASIGVAGVDEGAPPIQARDLVRGADIAMYRAKETGRNRIVLGTPAQRPPAY